MDSPLARTNIFGRIQFFNFWSYSFFAYDYLYRTSVAEKQPSSGHRLPPQALRELPRYSLHHRGKPRVISERLRRAVRLAAAGETRSAGQHFASCIRARPERPNHVRSYDFVEDRTHGGLIQALRSQKRKCARNMNKNAGITIVPKGSMCRIGLKKTRPCLNAAPSLKR